MEKGKFFKDGKFYNPETSTLIATSNIFMNYGLKRRKIYQTVKGAIFIVQESINQNGKIFTIVDSCINELLTEKKLQEMFEYTLRVGHYASNLYDDGRYKYEFHKQYSELFEVEEG